MIAKTDMCCRCGSPHEWIVSDRNRHQTPPLCPNCDGTMHELFLVWLPGPQVVAPVHIGWIALGTIIARAGDEGLAYFVDQMVQEGVTA